MAEGNSSITQSEGMDPIIPEASTQISVRPTIFYLSEKPSNMSDSVFQGALCDLWHGERTAEQDSILLGLVVRALGSSNSLSEKKKFTHFQTSPIYSMTSFRFTKGQYEMLKTQNLGAEVVYPYAEEIRVNPTSEQMD
jgi:hypothetical protein